MPGGDLIVSYELKERIDDEHDLEIEVLDTGMGIEDNRKKFLFIPYKELNVKESMKKVKNHSIGMGLACSKAIAKMLGGDAKLKHSEKGLTIFKVSIPILAKCSADHSFVE